MVRVRRASGEAGWLCSGVWRGAAPTSRWTPTGFPARGRSARLGDVCAAQPAESPRPSRVACLCPFSSARRRTLPSGTAGEGEPEGPGRGQGSQHSEQAGPGQLSSLGGSWHGVALGLGLHQGTPGGWQGPPLIRVAGALGRRRSFRASELSQSRGDPHGGQPCRQEAAPSRPRRCVCELRLPHPAWRFQDGGSCSRSIATWQRELGSWGVGGSTSLQADLLCYL